MIEKVFVGLISLILNFIFLNYVDKLEKIKCGCSQDWRRDFIKVYSILVIVLVCAGFFLDTKKLLKNNTVLGFLTLVQLAGFIYLYCLYTFSRDLKNGNCECSETWERKLIYNYSMIIIILYLLTIVMNVGVVLFVTSPRFEKVCKDVMKLKKKSKN